MAPVNYICLAFILGLFISLAAIPAPSLPLSALVITAVLLASFRWGRGPASTRLGGRFLPFAVLVFYLLGMVRPALAWDYENLLSQISANPGVEAARQNIKAVLSRDLPEPHASLAYGILFGTAKGQSFDRNFLASLRRTGTAHMVAVSGYNVSMVLGILLNTSILLVSKAFLIPGLLFLILYDVLVGFSASVMRATLMGLYLFTAGILGRQKNYSDALLISAAAILALSPRAFLDLGFQLSFLAMMAVLYLSEPLERVFKILPKELNKVVSATLASQILIMPVSVYSFGQISLIAPLANALTFITVPAIMTLTAFGALAGLVFPFSAWVFSAANFVVLDYFVKVVGALSSLKWASLTF